MLQQNRLFILSFILISFLFSACSVKYTQDDFDGVTSRDYQNISKDSIFEASKKIFIYEAKNKYRIDSYRDKLVVSSTNISFPPFDSTPYDDIFRLEIVEEDDISKATLKITRIVDFDESDPHIIPESIHKILWARIDFMLGLRKKWPDCNNMYVPLRYRSNALCDYKDIFITKIPTKEEQLKDILISDRKISKDLFTLEDDVLKDDIILTVDEEEIDLLNKENQDELQSSEDIDTSLDDEIKKLDSEVSKNIKKTLEDIETKEE